VLICLYLRLKKDNLFTADDNGLTLIHADEEHQYMNNSHAKLLRHLNYIPKKNLVGWASRPP